MVSFLLPDLSVTFIVALLLPLVIGFIVGLVIRAMLWVGIVIGAIVLVIIFLGILTPDQILQPIFSFLKSGDALKAYAERIAGYLPWSTLTFVIGAILGFLKG